jgi:hypothetical protein
MCGFRHLRTFKLQGTLLGKQQDAAQSWYRPGICQQELRNMTKIWVRTVDVLARFEHRTSRIGVKTVTDMPARSIHQAYSVTVEEKKKCLSPWQEVFLYQSYIFSFLEVEIPSPCSHKIVLRPYAEPFESSLHPQVWRIVLLVSSVIIGY